MLIGREKEKGILEKALRSNEAELVAVIGRRRVGKTFLIKTVYAEHIHFETIGVQHAPRKEQLENFRVQMRKAFGELAPTKPLASWQEAFFALTDCLEKSENKARKVLFFDELPWLAARKSGFLNAFSFFWNIWASHQNLVVVICGSAASWMIQKVVNDKGGLHNRITRRIELQPFNLQETEAFLKNRHVRLDRYQILQLYMAMGGVPQYLNEVESGKTAVQNINDICFQRGGVLTQEFGKLYPALFDDAENHIRIIRALAQKWSGMSRAELLAATSLADGGGFSLCLEELEASGFISVYPPFGKKKKEARYRLTDEYSLFYLQFIENQQHQGKNQWQHLSQTQQYKSWSGYAFESICLKHIEQINHALGISGIYAEASGFYQSGKDGHPGLQIDLLIDRNDNAINLFEIKFYKEPLFMDKALADEMRTKSALFKHYTQTRKHVFLNVLSTFGIVENEHSLGLIDKQLTMDVLFVGV